MKGLFIKIFAIGSILTCSKNEVTATEPTAVPGRTWWYTSAIREDRNNAHDVVYGLKLDDVGKEDSEGWLSCYAVNRNGEKLFEASLCKVRDEGSQVWVIPNLELEKEVPSSAFADEGAGIIRLFLGYWYGRALIPYDNLFWTEEPTGTPYLLYDYNYTSGNRYEWPWSGVGLSADDVWMDTEYKRGFFISDVSEETFPDGIVRKTYELCQLREGETLEEVMPGSWGTAKIVEGFGIVSGYLYNYIVDYDLCSGFWIAPASIGSPQYTGMHIPPTQPKLECIREADGTCVYGDAEFDPASVVAPSVEARVDDAIYDLQGRRVTNPAPGLYIRGGKKILVR